MLDPSIWIWDIPSHIAEKLSLDVGVTLEWESRLGIDEISTMRREMTGITHTIHTANLVER